MSYKTSQFLLIFLSLFSIQSFAIEHPELKAFPKEKEGMERFVIALPHKNRTEEVDFKVELIPGKKMLTDGVNLIRLGTQIIPQPLKGWGYTYYEVTGNDMAMSTMMAVPDNAAQVEKFVKGRPIIIQYNSRLPIVIYAAKGYEIQYRIWKAGTHKIADSQ